MRASPLLLLLLAGACTVGPDFKRPVVAGTDAGWQSPAATPGPVEANWWRALGDPTLDTLVEAALANNLDLREAAARLREARAGRDAAAGRASPEVSARGSATQNRISGDGQLPVARIPQFSRDYALFDLGFDASWEIDLWGGTRRSIEGAQARAEAAELRAGDVRLQVIAEVVRSYADLRAAQARRTSVAAEAEVRRTVAGLAQRRYTGGEGTRIEAAQAAQRAATVRAALPQIVADASAAQARLALLTGRPPEAVTLADAPLPLPPALVAAGIRSELLQRRPDVRAAQADLAAATADVGVETANLYPRFSLLGSLGRQSRNVEGLADGPTTRFSIGPSFSWPIFSAGRIRAQIRGSNARVDAAGARYEKAVLSALADSETALNRYAAARAEAETRDAVLAEAALVARLAERRWRAGEDDRLQALEAEAVRRSAEQAALAARAATLTSYAALSKALGGGWEAK